MLLIYMKMFMKNESYILIGKNHFFLDTINVGVFFILIIPTSFE